MIFKRLSLEHTNYTYEEIDEIKQKLTVLSKAHNGPMPDI